YYSVLCFMSTLPTTINIFTFSLHDALPILHALLLHHLVGSGERRAPMPYAWRGVRLHSVGTPSRLRVRARRTAPDTWSVVYTDTEGDPGLSLDGLTVREAPVATAPPALLRQDWPEVAG